MVVLTCASGHVKDGIIQNDQFQEIITKVENLNLKFDTLQSANMQLTTKVVN